MKLPKGDRALVPMSKIRGYCLNPDHSSGKHKARVFASALGITASNATALRDLVQRAAVEGEVVQQFSTAFGEQFKVDWIVPDSEQLVLRTIWEVTLDSSTPRLISAFIK